MEMECGVTGKEEESRVAGRIREDAKWKRGMGMSMWMGKRMEIVINRLWKHTEFRTYSFFVPV